MLSRCWTSVLFYPIMQQLFPCPIIKIKEVNLHCQITKSTLMLPTYRHLPEVISVVGQGKLTPHIGSMVKTPKLI